MLSQTEQDIADIAGTSNCKIKFYPDGTAVATFCSMPIFKCFPTETKLKSETDIEIPVSDVLPPDYSDDLEQDSVLKYIHERERSEHNKKIRSDSMKRAKDKIFDIVACNEWDYFFTGTLGDDNCNFDTTSAEQALKPLQRWLKNCVNRYGLKYILVAEYQPKGGRIHFHGFINDALQVVDSGTRLVKGYSKPLKLSTIQRKGIDPNECKVVFNIPQWRFGYTTAIKPYNGSVACANYITKYITKENQMIFGHYYWSSRNLIREPDIFYTNVDYESIALKEYGIPKLTQRFKYWTYFKGEALHFPDLDGWEDII